MSAPERPLDRRGIGVLAAGHLCSDMTQGAVAALLPFLISQRGLSYGAAGALLMAATVGSSFVQPVLGAFADRLSVPVLLPAGVMVGGAGVAVAAIVAALERFMRETAPAPAPAEERPNPWFFQGLLESIEREPPRFP